MEILTLHSQAETIWATHFSNFFPPFSIFIRYSTTTLLQYHMQLFMVFCRGVHPSWTFIFFLSYVLGSPRISLHDSLYIWLQYRSPLFLKLTVNQYLTRARCPYLGPIYMVTKLGKLTFPCVVVTVYMNVSELSRGARQLGWTPELSHLGS